MRFDFIIQGICFFFSLANFVLESLQLGTEFYFLFSLFGIHNQAQQHQKSHKQNNFYFRIVSRDYQIIRIDRPLRIYCRDHVSKLFKCFKYVVEYK